MTVKTLAYTDFFLLTAQQTAASALKDLNAAAAPFSFIIVDRKEDFGQFYYLFPRIEAEEMLAYWSTNTPGSTVKQALNLHEHDRTSTLPANADVTEAVENRYIVLDAGIPVGFIVYDYSAQPPPPPPPAPAPVPGAGRDGDSGSMPSPGPTRGGDPFTVPDTSKSQTRGGGDSGSMPSSLEDLLEDEAEPFRAFPSISDPGTLEKEAEFSLDIGFAAEADKTLSNLVAINLPAVKPSDILFVKLMPNGAEVLNKAEKPLLLNLDSKVTFRCKVLSGAKEVSLTAIYTFKGQLVGMATRTIPVGETPALQPVEKPLSKCQLSLPELDYEQEAIDLLTTVMWDPVAKKLHWSMQAHKPHIDLDAEIKIDNTREFAAKIGQELGREGYKGRAAFNALRTLGQAIAAHMPANFFEALKDVHAAVKRVPKVLILTDEAYIPWELAYHPDLRLDPDIDPFLHLQTQTGRWWANDRVTGSPPTGLTVNLLSALAADYPPDSSHNPLVEAIAEKKYLVDHFKARAVAAKKEDLLDLTGSDKPVAGHLMHMALHGFSKPDLNEQLLALEDGDLSAEALFGPYFCGDVPAISFLFLNACQVATAGNTLGQASGFPGIVLTKGVLGFLAPLWNVHDVIARPFSEAFYEETLGKGRPIGEVLLELRRKFDYKTSLTQLAYIYYGHPALKLKKT